MISSNIIRGIINIVIGLAIIIFRSYFSKSHTITIPKGFKGKSFEEKLGKNKGRKLMLAIGIFLLVIGGIFLIAEILGINLE
ncbi:MAG: hypothetical protein ABIH72_01640 [archaeon]